MKKNDILDYIYEVIENNKDKMQPADYLYLLMKSKDIQDKINEIKKRNDAHTR